MHDCTSKANEKKLYVCKLGKLILKQIYVYSTFIPTWKGL